MTKMFKAACLAATAAVALSAAPALAADSAVLVVDFGQVFQSSAAGKSGTAQLAAKYQPVINQKQAALQSAATTFQSQRDAVIKAAKPGTQPVATPALQQAGDRAQQAQGSLEQTQNEVNQVASYIRAQIIDHAGPIAEQIRAERKAAVVISKDAALASDPANDITSTLIQRLDTAFPTPSIVPPQQPGAAPAAAGQTQGR